MRRHAPVAIVLLAVALLLPAVAQSRPAASVVDSQVQELDKGETSFRIGWLTDRPVSGSIWYGDSCSNATTQVLENTPSDGYVHLVVVNQAPDGKTFYYKIDDSGTIDDHNGSCFTAKTFTQSYNLGVPSTVSGTIKYPAGCTSTAAGILVVLTITTRDGRTSLPQSDLSSDSGGWSIVIGEAVDSQDNMINPSPGDTLHVQATADSVDAVSKDFAYSGDSSLPDLCLPSTPPNQSPTATTTTAPTATSTTEPTATGTTQPTATSTTQPTTTSTAQPTATGTSQPAATSTTAPTATGTLTATSTATPPAPTATATSGTPQPPPLPGTATSTVAPTATAIPPTATASLPTHATAVPQATVTGVPFPTSSPAIPTTTPPPVTATTTPHVSTLNVRAYLLSDYVRQGSKQAIVVHTKKGAKISLRVRYRKGHSIKRRFTIRAHGTANTHGVWKYHWQVLTTNIHGYVRLEVTWKSKRTTLKTEFHVL